MQEIGWLAGGLWVPPAHDGFALPAAVRRAAQSETPLAELLLTLAQYQEEQARTASDLLEREAWALAVILERSAPIWQRLPEPTLRFVLAGGEGQSLEVGRFSHLSALVEPSADERALAAAELPCWARVSPTRPRWLAGQTGALARAYAPISAAEAIEALGLDRIMAQFEAAMRAAGQALILQAQAQRERQAQLARVEQLLGLEPEPHTAPLGPAAAAHICLALMLLGTRRSGRLALGGGLWALALLVASPLFGIPHLLLLPLILLGLALLSLYLGAGGAARG